MPTFKDLSSQSSIPVIYSQRKNGTILTAIKVPRDDVRLEKWGWILNLSQTDGVSSPNEIVTLQASDGQQYPKIYTTDEAGSYSERNGYYDWEVGYYNQASKIQTRRNTAPLNTDMLQKDMIQETLQNILHSQENSTEYLHDELIEQKQEVIDVVNRQFTDHITKIDEVENRLSSFDQVLQDKLASVEEKTIGIFENSKDAYERAFKSDDERKNMILEGMEQLAEHMPSTIYSKMKSDFDLSLHKIDEQLDTMDAELKLQLEQVQNKTSKAVEDAFIPLIERSQDQLTTLDISIRGQTTQSHADLIQEVKNYSEKSEQRLEELDTALKEQAVQSHTILLQEVENYSESSQKRLEALNIAITEQTIRSHENLLKEIKNYLEKSEERLEILDTIFKEQTLQYHEKIIKDTEDYYRSIEQTNQEKLDSFDKSLKESIAKQEEQIRDLNEQIKKFLELSNSGVEELEISTEEDLVTFADKVEKKPTTRISRMANTQLTISNNYYKNVNEQSKRSFAIARILSIVGGLIFIFTVSFVIVADALHIQKDPSILPGGALISLITEVLAGVNFLYNKATEQLRRFHPFLDRIIRASVAHAMVEDLQENNRQEAIQKIVENLLKNDPNIDSQDNKSR